MALTSDSYPDLAPPLLVMGRGFALGQALGRAFPRKADGGEEPTNALVCWGGETQ